MPGDGKRTSDEANRRKRYNEKEIIKRFLVSEKGIPLLVDNVREGRRGTGGVCPNRESMRREVDNIIDYYFGWINSFPVRRGSAMSRYEFLKYLEDFCMKNNAMSLFDFLFT